MTKIAVLFIGILAILLFIRQERMIGAFHNRIEDLEHRNYLLQSYIKLERTRDVKDN